MSFYKGSSKDEFCCNLFLLQRDDSLYPVPCDFVLEFLLPVQLVHKCPVNSGIGMCAEHSESQFLQRSCYSDLIIHLAHWKVQLYAKMIDFLRENNIFHVLVSFVYFFLFSRILTNLPSVFQRISAVQALAIPSLVCPFLICRFSDDRVHSWFCPVFEAPIRILHFPWHYWKCNSVYVMIDFLHIHVENNYFWDCSLVSSTYESGWPRCPNLIFGFGNIQFYWKKIYF